MRIGKLRHSVQLTSPANAADGFGEDIKSYTQYGKTWASINPLSGKELINAQQQIGEVTHRVKIRFNSAIAITHRIVHKGRTLEIISIRDFEERGHWQEIMCKEII